MTDIDWIEAPIIGQALLIMGAANEEPPTDSYGDKIYPLCSYRVGKQKGTGKVAIIKIENEGR